MNLFTSLRKKTPYCDLRDFQQKKVESESAEIMTDAILAKSS